MCVMAFSVMVGLTGAHVFGSVHVSTVIAVAAAAERRGLDGGATVERTLLT